MEEDIYLLLRHLCFMCTFFFFKQKTAYEVRLSFVGSEMCIRDSDGPFKLSEKVIKKNKSLQNLDLLLTGYGCLLYTSDAADEEESVDLGGRRYI